VTRKGLCRACETGIHVAVVLFAVVCHLKKNTGPTQRLQGSGFAHHTTFILRLANCAFQGGALDHSRASQQEGADVDGVRSNHLDGE
jgi:hypothetical protein